MDFQLLHRHTPGHVIYLDLKLTFLEQLTERTSLAEASQLGHFAHYIRRGYCNYIFVGSF